MLIFKIDIMQELKEAGYNTARIRKENICGQKTLAEMKAGKVPGIRTIDRLCQVLDMQPGNMLRHIPDPEPEPSASAGETKTR